MGGVFSICDSFRFIESIILRFGDAALETFKTYCSNYPILVQIASQFCEPAEIEPFEDFADVVRDSCTDQNCERRWHWCRESSAQPRVKQPFQTELLRKAQRFRRRFDLYGPPDWIDPGETILPTRNIYGLHPPNVIASLFPYAVPHIVIHFAPEPLSVACMNGLDCQDHEWGNRLIVVLPPSPSGPYPSVTRAASCYPFARAMAPLGQMSGGEEDTLSAAVPNLISDEDGSMISDGSSTAFSMDWTTTESDGTDAPEEFISVGRSQFWIPEDEDELPTLPENWLKPTSEH